MGSYKIGYFEALCILLIVTISHILLNIPKIILEQTGSSGALNIIYVTILGLIFICLLIKLYKNFQGKDILDISKYVFGSFFQKLIGIIFLLYMLFISSTLLRNLAENLKIIYFQDVPINNILLIFLISIVFVNLLNPRSVIKCNSIIVPLILIIVVILFLGNTGNFVIERFFPLLGYGAKETFLYGSTNIFIFGNIIYLYFLMPILKDMKDFNKVAYSAVIITSILLLVSVVSLLLMFPFVLTTQGNMPTYLVSRQINLGQFMQRADAFFLLIWIITILSYLGIALHFIVNIFKKITNIQDTKPMVYCFAALIFSVALLPRNLIEIKLLESSVYKYINLILIFGLSFLILLLANLKLRKQKSKNIRSES